MNQPMPAANKRDRSAWDLLRRSTPARIGLDRAGHAITTSGALDLGEAHARARDAVHVPLDVDALAGDLADLRPFIVTSQAPDRSTYLRRPDLGRLLASRTGAPPSSADVVFVLADGYPPPPWPGTPPSCCVVACGCLRRSPPGRSHPR